MEILELKGSREEKVIGGVYNGIGVRVSHKEALELICSLASQVRANSSDAGRCEHTPKGKFDYFTIYVTPEPRKKEG